MICFESQENLRRYKNFLSRWEYVISQYYSGRRRNIVEARREYTWPGSRDSLERHIKQTLVENDNAVTLDVFEEVEHWGFGVKPYPQSEPGTLPEIAEKEIEWEKPGVQAKLRDRVDLRFQVPKGKVANIMGVMNLLQSKFESLEIELTASGGEITEQDYEDKIKETFRQLGIKTDEG